MKRILKNLMILLVVLLPIWLLSLWLLTRILEGPQGANQWPEASLFYFVVLAPQVLLGGLVHQFVLGVVPAPAGRVTYRGIAWITSLVIPVVLLLFGGEASVLFSLGNLACMGLGLLVYSALIELPDTPLASS